MEYPTLTDPKFGRTIDRADVSSLNELPLMGVSTRRVDQTFVFTDTAIERLLRDHAEPFAEITFVPSPNPSRSIAFARRANASTDVAP